MSRSLWMGDLESWMDEEFINKAFAHVSQPVHVKMIKRKDNGLPAAYCFVEFSSEAEAERVLKLVNATDIPGTTPVKRYRLNRSQMGKHSNDGPSFSVFVGDLDTAVTEDRLQDFFAKTYKSVKGAKIMYDESAMSRGYGFVRFGDETEQKRALSEMQGATGLGSKAIRVSVATPKAKMHNSHHYNSNNSGDQQQQQQQAAGGDYSQQWMKHYADNYQYYQQYMQYYNQQDPTYQQQHYQQYQQYQQQQMQYQQYQQQQQATNNNSQQHNSNNHHHHSSSNNHHNNSSSHQNQQQANDKLEDPCPTIDVDLENSIYFRQRTILLDKVLGNHWQPVDTVNTKIADL